MNTFCGIVYERTEEGRVEVLVTIHLARLPALHEHETILAAYAEHYAIDLSKLKLSVCAMIPDPRLHDITSDGKLLFRRFTFAQVLCMRKNW